MSQSGCTENDRDGGASAGPSAGSNVGRRWPANSLQFAVLLAVVLAFIIPGVAFSSFKALRPRRGRVLRLRLISAGTPKYFQRR